MIISLFELWCGVNQTNRFIVCCSQRDYCNDLDAYSKDIRVALVIIHRHQVIFFCKRKETFQFYFSQIILATDRQRRNGFSTLMLIVIISQPLQHCYCYLEEFAYLFIKQKKCVEEKLI